MVEGAEHWRPKQRPLWRLEGIGPLASLRGTDSPAVSEKRASEERVVGMETEKWKPELLVNPVKQSGFEGLQISHHYMCIPPAFLLEDYMKG